MGIVMRSGFAFAFLLRVWAGLDGGRLDRDGWPGCVDGLSMSVDRRWVYVGVTFAGGRVLAGSPELRRKVISWAARACGVPVDRVVCCASESLWARV